MCKCCACYDVGWTAAAELEAGIETDGVGTQTQPDAGGRKAKTRRTGNGLTLMRSITSVKRRIVIIQCTN